MKRVIEVQGRRRTGFTLVELLVVIGVIAMLIAMLMPALNKVKAVANSAKCKSNMQQVGYALMAYTNDNRSWLFPVGAWIPPVAPATEGKFESLGTNVPAYERWPVHVFKDLPPVPAVPTATDDNADKYTPQIMRCPSEGEPQDPMESVHSYILNKHLAKRPDTVIKAGSRIPGARATSDVILMGEKVSAYTDASGPHDHDYYMEFDPGATQAERESEFDRIVEKNRHGIKRGSNYLYMDYHVDTRPPKEAFAVLDPWDLPIP